MGAQWKHAGRVAGANKRGAIISKMVKEIMAAARVGDPNPDNNSRLRVAVEAAKKASVTRENIERALKKASGQLDGEAAIEAIAYEGFAPHRVPLIVECLTDNKNRTAAEVRQIFTRWGSLGTTGSVAWMFDRWGLVEATHTDATLDIESVAIEAGAQNVEPLEKEEIPAGHVGARFYSEPTDLDTVTKFLQAAGWSVTMSQLGYVAKNKVELSPEQRKEVEEFLGKVDDLEDVQRIFVGM